MQPEKLPPWGNAVAGAAGAVMANALVYPLDVIKTRLQVQSSKSAVEEGENSSSNLNSPTRGEDEHHHHQQNPHYASTFDAIQKIIAHDGITGLYAGMPGSLIGVASTNFAYFYWYTVVRDLYIASLKAATTSVATRPPGTVAELSLGAISGALAQMFTIPVAVVTIRQQTRPKGKRKGLVGTGKEIVHGEDGWTGLWRGLKASLVLVANPSITYAAYQRLRELVFAGKAALRPWEAFVLGALSKGLATILTQPLIVAKVGLQSHPPPIRQGKPFRDFMEVMYHIVEFEGSLALFKGIGPQLLKGLLVQGLLMMIKERVEFVFLLIFRYIRRFRSVRLHSVKAAGRNAPNFTAGLPR